MPKMPRAGARSVYPTKKADSSHKLVRLVADSRSSWRRDLSVRLPGHMKLVIYLTHSSQFTKNFGGHLFLKECSHFAANGNSSLLGFAANPLAPGQIGAQFQGLVNLIF